MAQWFGHLKKTLRFEIKEVDLIIGGGLKNTLK